MNRCITGGAFLLLTGMLCSPAQATHIQYIDRANVTGASIGYPGEWSCTFKLTEDMMKLWELTTPTSTSGWPTTPPDYYGSYNPLDDLHYVTLRIDPNNTCKGTPTSNYIKLTVNGAEIANWSDPIRLYDWGVPGGSVSDAYNIAGNDYKITVTLTGLSTLGAHKTIPIDNVNLEGCFDTATPVPEPATMFLFGTGLAGLAGYARKNQLEVDGNLPARLRNR